MVPTIQIMKFEDFLMQQSDDKQKRLDLENEVNINFIFEVESLRVKLEEEQTMNKVLHSALHGPVSSQPCLAFLLPPQVQGILTELAMVEEEIIWLERKVDELKLNLYQERKQTEKWKLQRKQQRKLRNQNHLPPCRPGNASLLEDNCSHLSRSQHFKEFRKFRRASVGSAEEMSCVISTGSTSDEKSRRGRMQKEHHMYKEICDEKPNELSEELIKCLIGIFLDLNQPPQDRAESAIIPKLGLSCMSSKISKPSFNSKSSMFPLNHNTSNLDPYCIIPDLDSNIRDIGPYKNFIHIVRNSLDVCRFSEGLSSSGKMRVLIQKLGNVDLTFLTYKQKLAFWINIYNASIMHAFLEHGLPSSQEKLLAIMNKAALNVGGIVLNALAIEHFILRHPCETKHMRRKCYYDVLMVLGIQNPTSPSLFAGAPGPPQHLYAAKGLYPRRSGK
ncbi:uncharacterized protein LOC110619753 isoform X3 [Manihot esculenta]|nr:uncharacterized protein LOC110619753 isoform X3 [Manihot esculenta]